MNLNDFENEIEEWKPTTAKQKYNRPDIKVNTNIQGDIFYIFDDEGCGVVVTFKQPTNNFQNINLSIFQSELLYGFYSKRLPYAYADYHECTAGKRFIENIESIIVYGKKYYVTEVDKYV